jgi:CubicO group peptidase (beta-lactamase class C family)
MKILLILFQTCLFVSAIAQPTAKQSIWPTSTPEEQGISSVDLNEMFEYIKEHKPRVHSIQVLRHGRLVLDTYFYPYTGESKHDIASVTKSINSTLVGIAIDKHYITSIKNRALQYFSKYNIHDTLKQEITLEDLITMRSGFDCGADLSDPQINFDKRLADIRRCKNWTQCILNMPMHSKPGERFAYCNANCHLLSGIIKQTTNKSMEKFAYQELFKPLGITDFYWPKDPKGINYGWADLQLYPYDMLKIGELMLHKGKWHGEEIVSENWLKQATTIHVQNTGGSDKYGYYWWLPGGNYPDVFEAVGRGGQRITVWPSNDIVIVFTGGGFNTSDLVPFIAKAIKSENAIAANPIALRQLKNNIRTSLTAPQSLPVAELPDVAFAISGNKYQLQPNSLDLNNIQFVFNKTNKATMTMIWAGEKVICDIGLDGKERFTHNPLVKLPQACKGGWSDDTTFSIKLDLVGGINLYNIDCMFIEKGEKVNITISEGTGLNNEKIAGRKQKSR